MRLRIPDFISSMEKKSARAETRSGVFRKCLFLFQSTCSTRISVNHARDELLTPSEPRDTPFCSRQRQNSWKSIAESGSRDRICDFSEPKIFKKNKNSLFRIFFQIGCIMSKPFRNIPVRAKKLPKQLQNSSKSIYRSGRGGGSKNNNRFSVFWRF